MTEPQTGRCEAYKPTLGGGEKQCPRPAQYGSWCHHHARSIGGWRLAPPDIGRQAADAALAALAETVEQMPSIAVGADWPKGEPNKAYTVWAVSLEAVLEAIEKARR